MITPSRFLPAEAIARAQAAFSAPPPLDRIVRPTPAGKRIAVFALPLDLCKPQNRTSHGQAWRYARDKARLANAMALQLPPRREPLPGRPHVVCVRFSSVEPDSYNDSFKAAVDVLCMPNSRAPRRLNLLRDDRPKDALVLQRWEPAKPKCGFAYLEVWSGET